MPARRASTRLKILALLYALLVAGIVALADTPGTQYIFVGVRALPGGDKTAHFLVMGLLSFVVNLALAGRTIGVRHLALPLGTVIVLLLVTAEEFSQLLVKGRTFDRADLLCDVAGIALGHVAARLARRGAQGPHSAPTPL